MTKRITGFDLARAYAILGMFIVNFNYSFGSFQDSSNTGHFLNLFTGNSTAIFIICAGMGVSLMTDSLTDYSTAEKQKFRSAVLRRSWFLVGLGLLLFNWWPGDILHFYGGYMHIAAYLLFVPRKYLLISAAAAILAFHVLLLIIPIWTSWDLTSFKYQDFWTVKGILRNTFYNGWNSIFPWIAYFLLGMWLGKINWLIQKTRRYIFLVALFFFLSLEFLRKYIDLKEVDNNILNYILADYFPPYLPFMVITASFALMVIMICIELGERLSENKIVKWMAITGRQTLTNYVFHLTIGMLLFEGLSGKKYTGYLQTGSPVSPIYILCFSLSFFVLTVSLSVLWSKRFKKGPMELLMRKIAG